MKRTVLITGASRGLGRAFAERILARGDTVISVSRSVPEIGTGPGELHHFPCDLGDLDALPGRLGEIVAAHPEVNTVISNAGAAAFGFLEQLSPGQIRDGIDLNFTSHVLVARVLIPALKRHDRSDLFFVGSEASLRGSPRASIYCSSKFALRGLAQSLRHEGATSGMKVTLLLPGMMRTPFFETEDFEPGDDTENAIALEDMATAVEMVLDSAPGTVFEELTLQPMKRVVKRK